MAGPDAERAKRLRAARVAAGYLTPAAFADAHDDDIVESTYRSHENGTRNITENAAKKYASYLGTTWQHLMFGEREEASAPADELVAMRGQEYAMIAVFDLRFSAGPSAWAPDESGIPLGFEPLNRNWLRSITSAPTNALMLARVDGDSMMTTLHSGDQVLVDRTRRQAYSDGIYALRRMDDLQVKRIAVNPRNGLLTIISDNPQYPRWDGIPPDAVDIIGRVIWLGRQV